MNLTGRERNGGSFTEKLKSALRINTAFGHSEYSVYEPLLTKITVIQYHFVKLSHVNYIIC